MRRRLLFLLTTYVVTVLLFMAAKVAFVVADGAGHDVAPADMTDVLRHGLTLDLSTALYLLVVPLLAALASVWVRVPGWVLRAYFAVVSFTLSLAFVADASLYRFWGFKLDASCLQYLSQPEGITQSVSAGYLLVRFLLVAALTAGVWSFYRLTACALPPAAAAKPQEHRKPLAGKAAETLLYVLLMPLVVIGMRGGFSESTTNIGQVYYSQNQFLNHAAVNPVFSFLYSLAHQPGDAGQYQFMDDDECQRLTADVYTTESILTDTLLTTTRPHVVVILLESCGEEFAAAMPRLQALKQQGVCFTRCYGNTWRTDRGTVCALSGYPSFPGVSVMKMPGKSRALPSVARTLQQQGYATSYLYGGDINFTNMRSYLVGTGWQTLTSMDDYSAAERHTAQWGVRDDITFATLARRIAQLKPGSQPQLMGYSTLSSHEPWDVPPQRPGLGDEVLNAFAYLDDCIHRFISQVSATPAWSNLLIILTADHGINYKNIDQSTPLEKNHIPMLWLGGAVRRPLQVAAICNQSDLAATLLGQMQLPHDDFAFSRDVTSATYSHPTAVHNYNNAQLLVDSTGHIVYDFDARRVTMGQAADVRRLALLCKAVMQRTYSHLLQLHAAQPGKGQRIQEK